MIKRVLGIDCSSTTIGYCLLEINDETKDIKYILSDYFKPNKKGSIIERIVHTRNFINEILNQYTPDYIGIEEIIQFMQGKSTAKTIITLTTFNRAVCLTAYDFLNKSPELFNVMSIRHGLKINKIFPKKEDMPALVSKHLGITFPYRLNSKNKIKVESYDVADGIAVALYYAFVLTDKIKVKKK